MTGHVMLGVTTLVALLTVATSNTCQNSTAGVLIGDKVVKTAIVPANVTTYDIQVPAVCPKNLVGLVANGCDDYSWFLEIVSKTTVHVYRFESPDEIKVTLELYCSNKSDSKQVFGETAEVADKTSEVEAVEDKTSEVVAVEHKTSEVVGARKKRSPNKTVKDKILEVQNVHNSPRKNHSRKKQKSVGDKDEHENIDKATSDDVENKTSESQNVGESKKSPKIAKDEKKKNKLGNKNAKKSKHHKEEEKTSEVDLYYTLSVDTVKPNEISKTDKVKKVGKSSVKNDKSEDNDQNKNSEQVQLKSKVQKYSKKVKFPKLKVGKGERKRRSAEIIDLELASSSEEIPDGSNAQRI